MIQKDNITVNFKGKEYIEYLKYKDSQKWKPSAKEKKIFALCTVILLLMIFLGILTDDLTSVRSSPMTWNNVLMFLGFAAGIGWIIHGTGFLLVRR